MKDNDGIISSIFVRTTYIAGSEQQQRYKDLGYEPYTHGEDDSSSPHVQYRPAKSRRRNQHHQRGRYSAPPPRPGYGAPAPADDYGYGHGEMTEEEADAPYFLSSDPESQYR